MSTIARSRGDKVFDFVNIFLLILIVFIVAYPLYFTLIASLSNPYAVSRGEVIFWVKDFTFEPYANIFINDDIWLGYANSIINTVIVTFYNLVLTIPCGYVLARRGVFGKRVLMTYFVITMYVSGGMIPGYLLVKQLGLIDTRWALIIPAGFSVYNMIITRTFFMSNISEELYEAAQIDGCNEINTFFYIALPLSKAIIAVIALYVAVAHWNDYFSALLYLSSKRLFPLQYVLRNILILNQQMKNIITSSMSEKMVESLRQRSLMAEGMKYSTIFISSLPMLIAYPFVQKYFIKGVMIGALKG